MITAVVGIFFCQAEDGIRVTSVTGVQTCALPIYLFEDFVRVLSSADELVLAEVYSAGEAPIVAADGRSLARAVRIAGKVEPVFVEGPTQMREEIGTGAGGARAGMVDAGVENQKEL